jgi:hypothetical protein
MANPNLTRIHQKIFSENAANNGQFGSLQTGTKVETPDISALQALAAYQEGWSDAVISGEELPSLEEFNGLHKIETEQLQYLLNKGIPEYSADAEYYIGDIQREVGGRKLYRSITDNNIGNALTDVANWEIYYDPDNSIFDNVTINNKLNTQPNAATISGGAITYTGAYMVIDTEGGAATDDLDTINGGSVGDILFLRGANTARQITIKHITGNIALHPSNDVTFFDTQDYIALQYDGTSWVNFGRSFERDFASSKTTNGYTYLPNGLIYQWGISPVIADDAFATITLPITYPNTLLNVRVSLNADVSADFGNSRSAGGQIVSNSQINISYNDTFGGSTNIFWETIGY